MKEAGAYWWALMFMIRWGLRSCMSCYSLLELKVGYPYILHSLLNLKGDLSKFIPIKTPLSGVTGPMAAASQISHWITECTSTDHTLCQQSVASPLPTRILEILGPAEVRLHTNGQDVPLRARYACLSHRWGQETFIQTRTSNLKTYESEVPWAEMPQTFRDAIDVTWRLGLRYLWIDSLCIIQDDQEDWRHEGSKMASTYSQSYITIAATAAPGPTGGLFGKTPRDERAKRICIERRDGPRYACYVASVSADLLTGARDLPLLNRAWVFQERYLSPRVVHFATNEMLWECKSTVTCECKKPPHQHHKTNNSFSDFSVLRILHRSWHNCPQDPDFKTIDNWHNIVSEYITNELTFQLDIFPALQGIATIMQRKRQTRYFAGLWEDSLIRDLLWQYVDNGVFWHPGTAQLRNKAVAYRAPSWSWAARLGAIVWLPVNPDGQPRALVRHIDVSPVGDNILGAVSMGVLCLEGNCITFESYERMLSEGVDMFHLKDARSLDDDYIEEGEIILMEIFHNSHGGATWAAMLCMVLEVADEAGHLNKRIGMVRIYYAKGKSPWHNRVGTVKTLTII